MFLTKNETTLLFCWNCVSLGQGTATTIKMYSCRDCLEMAVQYLKRMGLDVETGKEGDLDKNETTLLFLVS